MVYVVFRASPGVIDIHVCIAVTLAVNSEISRGTPQNSVAVKKKKSINRVAYHLCPYILN